MGTPSSRGGRSDETRLRAVAICIFAIVVVALLAPPAAVVAAALAIRSTATLVRTLYPANENNE